jgi:hypothetical protein
VKAAKVILVAFLVTLGLVVLIVFQISQPVSGVKVVKLVADCQLEFYDTTAQPVFTAVLSCPRVDSIRLWPLPILQPWLEDPILPPGSRIVKL